MKTFSVVVVSVSRLMFVIAGLAMASSVLLTVSDVILRCFRRPILGTYELVGILSAILIGFSLPQTSRTQGHVFMDMFTERLSPGMWQCFHIVSRIVGIFFFAIVSWYLWVMGNDYWASGEGSTTLQIPLYPVAYALSICCLVECLVLVVGMFEEKEVEK
ncbi:MAG: TRAP transporter small permease [Desulfomonile tiedjei]|uniref:TRAP transporter small permease n=1 Tax=Desulfomonile tiedjei TaxID=2358 RepID=A0A9D6V1R7_9BACT|nr:TRAP transporter small permease [Desulfomonile tiedjei]